MAREKSQLDVVIQGVDNLSPEFQKLESRLIRFVGAIGAGIAAIRIGAAPIQAAVEFERELANVRKTTNFTNTEMARLSDELLTMSTRIDVSAKELAKIAAAAGQQGLGREGVDGVVSFTESVSRMASVLDITVEQAGEDIGKIANIFKIPLREIEKTVSTFNEVSNNSTAKGEELLDVVRRIGDAAGRLNLEQSVAIAATGLDFGQSPEVVGTSFAKMFASLVQKQKDFARLVTTTLGISAEEWGNQLTVNGMDAFKTVLEGLRRLEPAAQQNTIIKMFGGGRIGSLVNKLVQDTSNQVLEKNLKFAEKGSLGFSAIQEQANVLNTVQAQAVLAFNALTKAGIKATESLLQPLIAYIVKLREAIESQRFQSFLDAVGRAFGDLIDLVAGVAKIIASLNVNWANIIPVVKAFLALKAAEAFLGLTNRVFGLTNAMKSIAKQDEALRTMHATTAAVTGLADASDVAAKRFSRAWWAQLVGAKTLNDELVRQKAIKAELAATVPALAKSQDNTRQAMYTAAAARVAESGAAGEARAAQTEVANRRAAIRAAVAAEAAELTKATSQKNTRVQAAEAEHATRVMAIQQDYQTRYAAIRATGTERGLKALREERVQALAEEEARHRRSLAGVESYWARRIALVQANARAAANAERLAYFQAAQTLDSKAGAAGAAGAAAAGAVAGAAAAQRDTESMRGKVEALKNVSFAAQAQSSAVGFLSAWWGRATLVFNTARNALGMLAGALSTVANVALRLFGWVGIIYTIAEMTGATGKLFNALSWLGEKLGFTSVEKEKVAVAAERARKSMEEEQRKVQDLTKAYQDLLQAKTPEEIKKTMEELADKSVDPKLAANVRDEALQNLLKQGQSIFAALDMSATQVARVAEQAANEVKDQLKGAEERAKRTAEDLRKITARYEGRTITPGSDMERNLNTARAMAADAEKALEAARRKDEEAQQKLARGENALLNARQNAADFSQIISSFFNQKTASLFSQHIVALEEVDRKIKNARDSYSQLEEEARGKTDETTAKRLKAAATEYQVQANDYAAQRAKLQRDFETILKDLLRIGDITPAQVSLLNALRNGALSQFVPTVNQALKGAPTPGTKELRARPKTGDPSGNADFSVKVRGQESIKRRLRAAEMEFAKEQARGLADLEQEKTKQLQSIADEAYRRGLKSLTDYYAEREQIQLRNIDLEIQQRYADVEAAKFRLSRPDADAAEKAQMRAEILRYLNEVAVLEERKKGIRAGTTRELGAAQRDFNKELAGNIADLTEQGLLPADLIQVYNRRLGQLRASSAEQLAKLRTENKEGVAKAIEQSFDLKAINDAVRVSQAKASLVEGKLSEAKTKIGQLRKAGAITTTEAENMVASATLKAAEALTVYIDEQQALLDGFEGALTGTPEFQQLQEKIRAARLELQGLKLELNDTARGINENLTQELTNILANINGSFRSIGQAFSQFLQAIGRQVIQLAARNSAEMIMGMLGSLGGSGGIGGAISGLFGGNKPDGTPDRPINTVTAPADKVGKGLLDNMGKTNSSIQGMWNGMVDSLTKSDNIFLQTLGTVLSVVGGGIAGIISAIFTTSAAEQASGGGGGGISDFFQMAIQALVAHGGGVVGQSRLTRRLVPPAAFAMAHRYHNGGQIGLRPNEVPIIGLKGEEVLTESDPRHRKNLKNSTGDGVVNVWVITPDQKPNFGPNDIVAVVADNIARNGSIKQLVKSVQMGR